jgi:hypothetical protein
MRTGLIVVALGMAAVLWVGVSAQQEMLPKPGPGSGTTKVSGAVSIAGAADVNASQQGDWRVAITGQPEVRLAAAPFVRSGSKYEITWTNGDKESVTIAATGHDGWVRVENPRGRWVNLQNARSVDSDR